MSILLILCYIKGIICLEDVKALLNFRKLKKRVLKIHNDDNTKGFVMKGRTHNKVSGSGGKSRLKSK
jgi:hypothetical protein